jgi:hypothetical protein
MGRLCSFKNLYFSPLSSPQDLSPDLFFSEALRVAVSLPDKAQETFFKEEKKSL